VKFGLTGLWQITGEAIYLLINGMDIKYIDNWCLLLDLRVLIRTIPVVILGHAAV
jgi:lipopolysaccharide/colanic/teichoic acid biosynthesis glycosyltransferase